MIMKSFSIQVSSKDSRSYDVKQCEKSGIEGIDELVGCIPKGIIAEFYGDFQLVLQTSYKVIANFHCIDGTAVGIMQNELINYDFYMLRMYARSFGCNTNDMLVSRAFRLEDAINMLKSASNIDAENIAIIDPYIHSPSEPRNYWKLARLIAMMRALSAEGKRVLLFNRVSKFGRFLPEGGNLSHHSAYMIVRLEIVDRRSYRATLIKHPSRPEKSLVRSINEILSVRDKWEGQLPLLEWL
ncbi:hypothetical protein FFONT_1241 [Fervidicoccus fontis Kam940]|uniref:DNA recombination and repair protein Rad51-like C-terminal domain-containing protein n=2 Tax=Fervidicoccus fontis TaxID=683846 RepID=I0A2M2_FERFK|nr:hypothetical protein FFONT_1241 [Fervidicoccus fontis Kam940]